MSDLDKRLADMRGRSENATEGPWRRHDFGYAGEQEPSSIVVHTGKFDHAAILEGETVIASMMWDAQEDANAEFIAHARTDLDDLRGAVEDVLALVDTAELAAPLGSPPYWTGHIRDAITKRLGG